MQNENNLIKVDMADRMSELMYKLDLCSAKIEQCAFDSINTTDQVMMSLQVVMENIQNIIGTHCELSNAIEICTLSLNSAEGHQLIEIKNRIECYLATLELELDRMAASASEANDAARCVESCIADQSQNVSELIACSEQLLTENCDL